MMWKQKWTLQRKQTTENEIVEEETAELESVEEINGYIEAEQPLTEKEDNNEVGTRDRKEDTDDTAVAASQATTYPTETAKKIGQSVKETSLAWLVPRQSAATWIDKVKKLLEIQAQQPNC